MTFTLLFDLDDTLLVNPIDTFLPEYTLGLAHRLKTRVEPQTMVRQLMLATGAMVRNLKPFLTLKNVFDEAFYPALNIQRQDVQPVLDEFYAQDFPKLQRLTQPLPAAIEAVNMAVQRGYRVAVATNPLFPKTAILQRLSWAGLPAEKYPWLIIPCFEEFHFAKPNVEYFGELLGQIGWPEGPLVMIGNDLKNDILPAQLLGLATFWVQDNPLEQVQPGNPRHVRGQLGELFTWLDQTPPDALVPNTFEKQALQANLCAAPAALFSLIHSLPESAWKARPSPGEWSLGEIACHLRDVEAEVNLPRLVKVLSKSNPFIPGKNTDVWADERKYSNQDGLQALNDFMHQRMKLVEMLAGLAETEWALPARHAIFGPIQLKELVSITASHDRLHLQTVFQYVNNSHTQ